MRRAVLAVAAVLATGTAWAQTPPAATDPATPPATAPAATAPPGPPPAMVPIARDDASTILGRQVLDGQGNTAGRITDVLVDATGVVRAAVVDFGGFLGVGQRRIAIAWAALRFDPATHSIKLLMSAPELTSAPEYKAGGTGNVVATPPKDIVRPSEKPIPAEKPPADEAPAR